MTLRHRLFLVYGIVILLSLGTVGVALFELSRSRQVFGALQYWNDIVLSAQKLRNAFPEEAETDPGAYFLRLVAPYPNLSKAEEYLSVDRAREALNRVTTGYPAWRDSRGPEKAERAQAIRDDLDEYARLVESQLGRFTTEVDKQDVRVALLPVFVAGLTLVHLLLIGWLLRRWLLHPIGQLSRQVEALGRDQPAPDPLLTSPRELAALAQALDEARQSLGSLRQQVIESERLTTIGQLAAQIAHNLRNPLASIRAAAQVSNRLDTPDTASAHRMQDIIASVDRMNQWVAGLMEIARRDPTPTRDADVTPILERVEEALRPEVAAKELTLVREAPAGGLVCAHDPATLEHALIAMLVNAIEASPLGSRIVLRGEYSHDGGNRPLCRICVEDRGSGLPPEQPERIFEFSYSTKQRGMGLGLALARQALQRQGGSAHARNNAEGGATVYVELPVSV